MTSPEPGQLWEDDSGSLTLESRRALVVLLEGPLIVASKQPQIWNAVRSDEAAIRSRLADVFLELVLDEDSGIAFTRQVRELWDEKTRTTVEAPKVLRTESLSHIDTLILLHLRTAVTLAPPGERVIVDVDDVRDGVLAYRAATNRDEAAFIKRFTTAIGRIQNKYGLLSATDTPGRLVVSPALRHIFDAETIAGIKAEYDRFAHVEEEIE